MKSRQTPKRFGLCGHPITHSLSPLLFASAYPSNHFSYDLIHSSDPEEAIRLFLEGGYSAMNVTAPFKTSILPFVYQQTPQCEVIGACNLILRDDDILTAHNTDFLGVARSLIAAQVPIKNAACLLLGAGGAAKAAAYALLKEGATLLWANRTFAHIPQSFNGFSVTSIPLDEIKLHLNDCHIVVNTLSQPLPLLQTLKFHASQTIFDASYAAPPLASLAHQAGARYIDGKQWLLHQAIPSFAIMTGFSPNIRAMEICLYPNNSLI